MTKHGGWKYHRPTYQSWQDMKQRCNNPNSQQFHNYGARGIRVCQRWMESFENFFNDMGEKPDLMTLDRIDNDGDYSPENCRWATKRQQRKNQRTTVNITLHGVTMCRRAFTAIYECQHCGHEETGSGYDDANFHNNVIPKMECGKCGKTGGEITSAATVPAHAVI